MAADKKLRSEPEQVYKNLIKIETKI